MATQTDQARSKHIDTPRLRGHRLHCPRCEGRLMFDGDEYVCVSCGYEFPAEELARDVQRALRRGTRPHEMLMAIGSAAAAGSLIGRGFGGLTWFGGLVGAGIAVALLIATAIARRAPS